MRIDDPSLFQKVRTPQQWSKIFPNHAELKKTIKFIYLESYLEQAAENGVDVTKAVRLLNYSVSKWLTLLALT